MGDEGAEKGANEADGDRNQEAAAGTATDGATDRAEELAETILRTVFRSRPSMREPVSRMFQHTTLAWRSLTTVPSRHTSVVAGSSLWTPRNGVSGAGM